MADTAFSETSRLLTRFHVRKIQRVAQHTLDEIVARFPSHLIDDVNARGLPPDRTLWDQIKPIHVNAKILRGPVQESDSPMSKYRFNRGAKLRS